ncbi:MAG: DUF2478 domain-containing protein [Hyphomicrobiaceae bacterium]
MSEEAGRLLAAISYQPGNGNALDVVMSTIASRLSENGYRVAGAVKHNTHRLDRRRCDMQLEILSSGETISISEDRGPEARGCSLDTGALESAVGMTIAGLERGADILVVNRFGKLEANGRGFRPAIEFAVGHDLPCLVGVSHEHMDAWQEFTGSVGQELSVHVDDVWQWCLSAQPSAIQNFRAVV